MLVLFFLEQLETLLEFWITYHLVLELIKRSLLFVDVLDVPLALDGLWTNLFSLFELLEVDHIEGNGVDALLC